MNCTFAVCCSTWSLYAVRQSDAARAEATIHFEIQDAKNFLNVVNSPPFYVRNVPWTIMLKRQKDGTHFGIFVCSKFYNQPKFLSSNWSCKAEVQLSLISQEVDTTENYKHLFQKSADHWGFPKMVIWTDVLDPTNGFLNDGAITVEARIVAEEPQGDS